MKKDEMGSRLKGYEARETKRKFLPYIPVYARIDGRSFSKFTSMAHKPFDESITLAMHAAARELIEQTNALLGYTQSDEISLVWETNDPKEEMFFDGKVQKMCSVLSGIATAAFIKALVEDHDWNARNPAWLSKLPHFDARVIQLPNRTEAVNMLLWREMDARKNAISMVAHSMFPHRSLQGHSGKSKLAMIESAGKNFDDFSVSSRRGAFMRRVSKTIAIDEVTRLKIPKKRRPASGTMVTRSAVEIIDMPPFNTVTNRVEVIFDNALPITAD